jgi:glycosyltransferase involved in cell wall biosynthesis
MRKPRIAFVTDTLGTRAGSEASLVCQAEMLSEAGWPALVAVYPRDDPVLPCWRDRLAAAGVPLVAVASTDEDAAASELAAAIGEFAADVIHFLPMGRLVDTWSHLRLNGDAIRVATETSEASKHCFWYGPSSFAAASSLDAIVAPCASVAAGIRELFGYSGPVAVLPHPVSTGNLRVHFHAPDEVAPPFRLAAISRLRVEKGIEFMLASMRRLAETHDVTLDVFGEQVEAERCANLCVAFGIADRVRLRGTFDCEQQQDTIIREAHLLLLSSLFEGLSLAVLNGIARGRVTVATRVGGIPEMLEPIDPCLVVPVADPAAMAQVAGALLDSPERLVALERRARACFLANYDPRSIADRHLRFYEGLLWRGARCG